MQPHLKIVVAVLVVALIAVIGLIVITQGTSDSAGEPAAETTAVPVETIEAKPEQQEASPTASPEIIESEEDAALAQHGEDHEEAQGTPYEGALAGLSEEEIGALAIAEEGSDARKDPTGGEDPVD